MTHTQQPPPHTPLPHAWFDEARFGLFLHWGLYSQLGAGEWVLFKEKLDRGEYNRLADTFPATRFDPHAWAALAKRAGMRYAVLTTRHHDGFCLFKTRTTRFNAAESAAGRDLVAEYVAACRQAGLRVGLYYSIMSWQHPAIYTGPSADRDGWETMVNETHAQVRELMTNYGPIDMLWYDGAVVPGIQDKGIIARFWRSRRLNAMVRELQPDILINNRSGLPEDFDTPEQHVNPPPAGRRWEACMTLNQSWGYNIRDRAFKSPTEVLKCLVRCARYGGNLLLNVGPRADGTIQPEFAERIEAVGTWLQQHGEAIYGSRRTRFTEADHVAGPTTWSTRRLYVHLFDRPGTTLRIDGAGRARRVRLLETREALATQVAPGTALDVTLPSAGSYAAAGPAVLAVDLVACPSKPARLLGGGDALRITAGDAPVLGDDPDRHAPPVPPVLTGAALEELLRSRTTLRSEAGATWCPGWTDWTVFGPGTRNRLELTLDVPVTGTYDLALGLIGSRRGVLHLTVDGTNVLPHGRIRSPGCPDTHECRRLVLTQGRRRLSVTANVPFGLYALRLAPCWRALPSDLWRTIGPFPTAFGPQQPVSEVRKALGTAFAPEQGFAPSATYDGAKGLKVAWTTTRSRRGEHADCGVNFPYRCGTEASGVCYARTVISSPEERRAEVLVGCDWWAKLWVNGRPVRSARATEACAEDGAQFNGWKPQPARVRLQRGKNVFLVKCHPGSCANWFTGYVTDPGDLECPPERA